ncbi:hypothetical protein HMN09_00143100 [Mycena chlorophos]|uniref:Phosphoglycerate mutase-like protein n=1 Tax=Mycena chlorophos TaxID=658473 RepID=A0A8H6TPR3_MYCCL|nr:hypothetical protein HMN09_00143100 [Mycena chlorophos]
MSDVLGVLILARNGARTELYQDPATYATGLTDSTPLGVATLHALGQQLRGIYLTPGSASYIDGMTPDLVENEQMKVLAKAGGEGGVVFDSAIALLQGMFPPTSKNKVTLADGTVVMAPLGGYQYVPLETVEPGNDRSMESWTDCPNFKSHISEVHSSAEFKAKAKDAAAFLADAEDFLFGRTASLENIWNIHDFMSTQLTYNQTYAYRLPPGLIDQARGFADWHEDKIFSDDEAGGIGNIAGRTLMHTILSSFERIAFNNDPLKMVVLQTTYQPFISLFHEASLLDSGDKQLAGIPDFGSALAIELLRGAPPDTRDFLRFKFLNNTAAGDGDWELVHPFGTKKDIALTEFVYRAEGAAIESTKEWAQVCGTSVSSGAKFKFSHTAPPLSSAARAAAQNILPIALALMALLLLVLGGMQLRKVRNAKARKVRLQGEEGQLVVPPVMLPVEKFQDRV